MLRLFAVFALLLFGAVKEGYGQRVYATSASSGGSSGSVSNQNNAVSPDGVMEPSASPPANISVTGSTLPIQSRNRYLQLLFGSTLPPNTTVFLRVANESTNLIGGSFAVTALNNNVTVTSSSTKFTTTSGWELYAVNVTGGNFNQVRITATGNALGGQASVDVYYAFYEPTTTECATVLGTTADDVTGVGVGEITNPANAIDGNLDTYAEFSITGLSVTASQTVFFSNISNPGEAITATFSVPDGLLNLDLLGNITVAAYRGDSLVSSSSINNLLTADLLGLLNDGERYSVSYVPSGVFDRVVVSMSATVGLLANLYLHEVQRTPDTPEIPALSQYMIQLCEGENRSITAQSVSGSIIRWYDSVTGDLLQQSASNVDSYVVGPYSVGTHYIHVVAVWDTDCPAESERIEIEINVSGRPPAPNVQLTPNSQY